MATGFSVFVNIGGKVDGSLAGAVNAAKAQVNGLAASLTGIGARLQAPFESVQRHIDATTKHFERLQKRGRDMSFAVTAPTGLFAINAIKAATERAKAANALEALGEMSPEGRKEAERFADSISAKYGDATGILKTFGELLKAGFDAKSAKASLPAILSGSAIAGDMTGAELGGYVSKTVNQFKLGMATTEEATASSRRIVDNLVYGAVKTVASTKDMAEAYKYVGSAAAAAGESVESTNAMIIALAKEGQLGSEAGVALRSAYVRMVKPTKGSLATLSQLGLSYSDYVQPGQRSSAGIVAGLSAGGFDASAQDIDNALSNNKGNPERQRRAIYDAVVSKIGANSAVDREAVLRAVDDAFALAGSKVDLTKLLTDLRKKGATQGDLAKIFEGRQSVRMLALLKSDLESLLNQINREAPGFSEKTWAKTFQGLPKAVLQLDAAWKTFRNTLVEVVTPEIVGIAERLANAIRSLADTSPDVLKIGIGLAAALAAAGPLLFMFGALGRVAMFALGGINTALMLLLAPIGLVARGLVALGAGLGVAMAASMVRIRALVAGVALLSAMGGTGAVFGALGASLLAFGRSVLLFPLMALRAIGLAMWALVANPVGIAITAVVAALAALGIWIYNNWEGIKSFFAGFGEGFMKGLGPAGEAVKTIASGLGAAWEWLSKLLGPLDATNTQWAAWGATLGGAVATGVNAVITGIQSLIGFFSTVIGKATAFGSVLRNLWPFGGGAANGASPGVVGPPVAGARALGGPVDYGKAYLVGERGPELFMPGASGRVETNDTLRRLTADGTAATAASSRTVNTGAVNFNPTFNISGDNPREVAGQIRAEMHRFLAELQSEQRGLLSD
jgi:hypothetical protein